MHICIIKLTIIVYPLFMSQIVLYFLHSTSVLSFHIDMVLTLSSGSDNGLSPGRCQAII